MRKLIMSTQMSLDGVMEAPERWAAPFWGDPAAYRYALDELRAAGLLVMGRKTYEGFAGYWPHAPADDPVARLMNSLPKLVASTTLESAIWNATVVSEDLPATLAALKEEAGEDIMLFAGGELFGSLRPTGLVDEYRIRLTPAIAGQGRKVFDDPADLAFLRLLESRTFSSGVVLLSYVPDPTIGR